MKPFRRQCILIILARLCCLPLGLCLPTTVLAAVSRDIGVDVSHYDGESGISQSAWNQMHTQGNLFAFIKASEGLTGPDDTTIVANVTRATAAGLLAGVYHVAHAENRPTTDGAIQEADHFLSFSGGFIGPGRLRPVLDLEQNNTVLTKAGLTDWIIAFSNEIIAQRGAGAAPIIYLGRSSANNEVDSRLANYDFWLAYPTNVDAWVVDPPPTIAYPHPSGLFSNWSFWQYTWTGVSGGLSNLDLNVCHSESKPLNSFLIPTPLGGFSLKNLSLEPGSVHFSFTNVPGSHFTIVSSTNVMLPLSKWVVSGTASEGPVGTFQFADTNAAGSTRRFYRVRSP